MLADGSYQSAITRMTLARLAANTARTLGLVEEKDENYEKAHEYFSKAMELYPEYPHLKNVLYPRILSELEKS